MNTYILAILLFFSHVSAKNSLLNQIPEEDKQKLKELFSNFVRQQDFGYTLFGDKPVSIASFSIPDPPDFSIPKEISKKSSNEFTLAIWLKTTIISSLRIRNIPLWQRWKTWEHYRSLFPIKNYLLFEKQSPQPFVKSIFLINKKKLIERVDKHLALFRSILGNWVSGDALIKEIEKQQAIMPIIQNNTYLLGILLGYGSHNAYLFNKNYELTKMYDKLKNLLVKDAAILSEINTQIEVLNHQIQSFNKIHYSPLMIAQINFGADIFHPQTKNLRKKYNECRKKTSTIFAREDVLEATLLKLIED